MTNFKIYLNTFDKIKEYIKVSIISNKPDTNHYPKELEPFMV